MADLVLFLLLVVTMLAWYAFAITCDGEWSELREQCERLRMRITRWQARMQARMWNVGHHSALDEQVWTVPEEQWSREVEEYFEQHYVEEEGEW